MNYCIEFSNGLLQFNNYKCRILDGKPSIIAYKSKQT